jgi:Ser-tRNA(Ala) deacylase AlaX
VSSLYRGTAMGKVRIVTFAFSIAVQGTDAGCPCGGTHVGDVAEIQGMRITGVRVKKGVTRVSYVID